MAATRVERKAATDKMIWDHLLSHECVDCGETDIVVLEFDHLPEHQKQYNIAKMGGMALAVLATEIAKCDVVCANCHKRRTAKRQGWRKQHLTRMV